MIGEKLHKTKLIIRVFNAAFAAGSDPAEADYKTIIDLAPEDHGLLRLAPLRPPKAGLCCLVYF